MLVSQYSLLLPLPLSQWAGLATLTPLRSVTAYAAKCWMWGCCWSSKHLTLSGWGVYYCEESQQLRRGPYHALLTHVREQCWLTPTTSSPRTVRAHYRASLSLHALALAYPLHALAPAYSALVSVSAAPMVPAPAAHVTPEETPQRLAARYALPIRLALWLHRLHAQH